MSENVKRRVFNMPDDEWRRLQRIAANDFLSVSRWIRLALLECIVLAEVRQSNPTSRPSLLHSSPILHTPAQAVPQASTLSSHRQGIKPPESTLSGQKQTNNSQLYDANPRQHVPHQNPWVCTNNNHPDILSGNWRNYEWVQGHAPRICHRISMPTGEIYWVDFTTRTYGSDVHQEPRHLEYDTVDPNDPEFR